jgi:superoxide dismutase, Cu-Zn family
MNFKTWTRRVVLGSLCTIGNPLFAATGVAELKGTADGSKISGTVHLEDITGGLKVRAFFRGVPAGEHAFHIHEFGGCGDMGKAAGSHYNPMSAPHGHIMKDGTGRAHAGDMGNVVIAQDGTGNLEAFLPGVTLSASALSVAGRAIILHDHKDDFSQPVGNAGGRIACGPIVITGPASPIATPAATPIKK